MDNELDLGAPAEPGPRLAQTLAEQERARKRIRVGIAIAVIGVIVAALAVAGAMRHDKKANASPTTGTTVSTTAPATLPNGAKGTAAAVTTTTPGTSAKAHWPGRILGRPKVFGALNAPPPADAPGLDDGFYFWSDFGGWHLWLVGGADADTVTFTADAPFARATGTGGSVSVDNNANVLTFSRGSARAKVVGVDFAPGFYAKTIVVSVTGDLPLKVGTYKVKVPPLWGLSFSTVAR